MPGRADAGPPADGAEEAAPPLARLPEPVRRRVVGFAAAALPDLDDVDVPAPLRRLRSFTPSRRARLGGAQFAAALESESTFRAAVAGWLRSHDPALVDALDGGEGAGRAPVDLAAAAWTVRSPALVGLLGPDAQPFGEPDRAAGGPAPAGAGSEARLRKELRAARAQIEDLRATLERVRASSAQARRRDRAEEQRAQATETALREALVGAQEAAAASGRALAAAEEELRRLRRELSAAQARGAEARRGERQERQFSEVRLRVLVDAVTAAAQGLARELALPPGQGSPAALASAGQEALVTAFSGLSDRALETADVALVEQLLRVPGAHLIVDGYNVTKTGYPTLPLEAQRQRLATALAAVAARTGTEVSCVFDGTARTPGVAVVAPRAPGVRVLFSPPQVLADAVIVELVHAEPPGRPVLVATSDGEVARAVRAQGARVIPSAVLLARLDR